MANSEEARFVVFDRMPSVYNIYEDIYLYLYLYLHIYIYIYIEREREFEQIGC